MTFMRGYDERDSSEFSLASLACALSCESVDITIVAWHAVLFIVHAQRGVQVNYICECHLRALHYSEQVQERALLLHILRYGDNARDNSKIGPLR